MSNRRRLMLSKKWLPEYLVFESSFESEYWALYYGDSYKGAGVFAEKNITFPSNNITSLWTFCVTEAVSAHKSSKQIRKKNGINDITSKPSSQETITILVTSDNTTLPWDIDLVTENDFIVDIIRRSYNTTNTTIERITKDSFLTAFTFNGEYWEHSFVVPTNVSCVYLNLRGNPDASINIKLYSSYVNHIHPIGITKDQLKPLTEINSRFCNGLIGSLEGTRYCDRINNINMGPNNLSKFYGGKIFKVTGDSAFKSYLNHLTYVLLPKYTTSQNWVFRGAIVRHIDLGWLPALNTIFNYHEFTGTEGWTLVLRSNNPVYLTRTLEDGTIFVPQNIINNYIILQNVADSRGLLIAPIGGEEWQNAFSEANNPESEYANVKVYCPEWYDDYVSDYEEAKELAAPAGSNIIPEDTYDAEIEYLETDGNAFINAKVLGTSKTKFELEFYVSEFTPPSRDSALFGSLGTTATMCCAIINKNTSNLIWKHGNKNSSAKTFGSGYWKFSNMNDVNILETNNGNISVSYSGKYSTSSNFYIFATTWSGSSIWGIPNLRFIKGKISNGAVIVRDFIPVRVGETGYLFDKISKKLFGNANTSGEFILGPDHYDSEIEYLESTGELYIMTYIYGSMDLDFYVEFEPLELSNEIKKGKGSIFGSRTDWNNTVYQLTTFNKELTNKGHFICASNYGYSDSKCPTANLTLNNKNILKKEGLIFTKADGTTFTLTSLTFTTQGPITIFGYNYQNNINVRELSKIKLYKLQFSENGVVKHDFIPVRKGNVGYLYDKVTKHLFGNANNSEGFILGPDKVLEEL